MKCLVGGRMRSEPTSLTGARSTRFICRAGAEPGFHGGENRLMNARARQRHVLPGFGLSLGFTLFYLCLVVLIPLAGTFMKTATLGWPQFWEAVLSERALASYR